jgi:hypothetical protein
MKYLLCFVLAYATAKPYSQLDLGEMMTVYNMNLDQFESFVIKRV